MKLRYLVLSVLMGLVFHVSVQAEDMGPVLNLAQKIETFRDDAAQIVKGDLGPDDRSIAMQIIRSCDRISDGLLAFDLMSSMKALSNNAERCDQLIKIWREDQADALDQELAFLNISTTRAGNFAVRDKLLKTIELFHEAQKLIAS